MEFGDILIFVMGIWMLKCAIRSFKRKWVWKYESSWSYDSHRTDIKFHKDTNPFYFWLQVILGATVGCLFIYIPFAKSFALYPYDPTVGVELNAEKARLQKDLVNLKKIVRSLKAKLENQSFITKARPEIIEGARHQLLENEAKLNETKEALSALSSD